jgi:hypothetical protein
VSIWAVNESGSSRRGRPRDRFSATTTPRKNSALPLRHLPWRGRAGDNDTVDGGADVLSSGRDPDRPPRWRARWRLAAAAAAVALIGAGIMLGPRLTGQPSPPNAAAAAKQQQTVPAMLGETRLRPDASAGTLLLGGPGELRLLNAGDHAPAGLGWADSVLGVSGSGRLGPSPSVRQIAAVSGGVVALLGSGAAEGYPAIGAVFFIPVTSRGAAAPRLIAWASYLAVALNQRDIWVEQASVTPGRWPDPTWLIDESGRRLSPALQLHGQVLLAATVRGLLTQGPSGQGAALISPASGGTLPAGVPGDAFVVAAGPDDVAWQPASCGAACSLHITSLRDGTDTVIPLPPRTFPDDYPAPAAFGPAGRRLALPMITTNREDRITGTSVYVVDIGPRRLIRVPGGPIPLSAIPAYLGAVRAGSPDIVSVRWAGSGLWIVATDGQDTQVAYWAGAGPLRVLAPVPGAAYTFTVARTSSAGLHRERGGPVLNQHDLRVRHAAPVGGLAGADRTP